MARSRASEHRPASRPSTSVPRHPRPPRPDSPPAVGSLLAIQRLAGNAAATLFVQRGKSDEEKETDKRTDRGDDAKGAGKEKRSPYNRLATKGATMRFATAAYKRYASQPDMPFEPFARELVAGATVELRQVYPDIPDIEVGCDPGSGSGDAASFNRMLWSTTIHLGTFTKQPGVTTIGGLSSAEVADVVDSIYHETRHAQQALNVVHRLASEGTPLEEAAKLLGFKTTALPGYDAVARVYQRPGAQTSPGGPKFAAKIAGWQSVQAGSLRDFRLKHQALADAAYDDYHQIARQAHSGNASEMAGNFTAKLEKWKAEYVDPIRNAAGSLQQDARLSAASKVITDAFFDMRTTWRRLGFRFEKLAPDQRELSRLREIRRPLFAFKELTNRFHDALQTEVDAIQQGKRAADAFKGLVGQGGGSGSGESP